MVYSIRELIEVRLICVICIRTMSKRRVVIIFVQKELTAFVEYLKKAKFIIALYSIKEKKKCKKDTTASSKQKKGNESKVNPSKLKLIRRK